MGVQVHVDDDVVEVRFTGIELLLALKGHVALPVEAIRSARVAPVPELEAERSWRVFGSYLPGVAAAGTFAGRGDERGRQLWCVERDDEALVVELEPGPEQPYRRVVLQHPDRHDLAWWIGERLPA